MLKTILDHLETSYHVPKHSYQPHLDTFVCQHECFVFKNLWKQCYVRWGLHLKVQLKEIWIITEVFRITAQNVSFVVFNIVVIFM